MRLLVCVSISVLLHAALLRFGALQISVPTLAIGPESQSVDLQIRTRVKKEKFIAPAPEKKPEPTPPPVKKQVKKRAPKPEKAPVVEEKKPEPKQVPPAPEIRKQGYVSNAESKPRLIKRAEYFSNPPPVYPDRARRRRQEGTVTFLVHVGVEGTVTRLLIQESSGFALLDSAAEKAVRNWRFAAATVGERRVPSKVIVPVVFKLNR